jgi:hypothetical protein
MEPGSRFWAETREKVDAIAKLVREAGGKNLEGPEICAESSPGYYGFFKIRTETNWKSAAAKVQSLRSKRISTKC